MAKKASRSQWHCTACGAVCGGWFGRCPTCGEWNTVEEVAAEVTASDRVVLGADAGSKPKTIAEVGGEVSRRPTGLGEVDRVLGGGLVPGSVVLLGGPPGIGKSTLLLQASAGLADAHGPVLYASGEESAAQVAGRARRLGASPDRLHLMAETVVERIADAARELGSGLAALVVDSIQTVYSREHEGLPGNVTQIRAAAAQLTSYAKNSGVPVVVVGHVTKDGNLAGPRVLEHMVDAVLSFDGDDDRATRLLRATKNRFGSTMELGVFEMAEAGLVEITNPSEAFLAARGTDVPGACVTATLEGSRPLLLEIQALLTQSFAQNPRRNCVGIDPSRLAMLLAVLDRHGDQFVLDQDVFVNVAGGLRLREPAADLAILLAVASAHTRKPLPSHLVAVAEIGLTGELRPAAQTERRLAEAARLGFRTAVIARSRRRPKIPAGLDAIEVATVAQALDAVRDG